MPIISQHEIEALLDQLRQQSNAQSQRTTEAVEDYEDYGDDAAQWITGAARTTFLGDEALIFATVSPVWELRDA